MLPAGPPCHSLPLSGAGLPPLLADLGRVLWRTLGYTQLRIDAATQEIAARRPLASGGARYPADLSMVVAPGTGGALGAVAGRVLHYAPQYHRLFLDTDGDAVTAAALGLDALAPGTLLLVVRIDFLRTWEKYGDFAYRLSAGRHGPRDRTSGRAGRAHGRACHRCRLRRPAARPGIGAG
ncbi:hypothetical protein LP419_15515 [Massilia sp. H-1]|nr:hypothetical protein LP419_15515 [Massilia sp. H-1]